MAGLERVSELLTGIYGEEKGGTRVGADCSSHPAIYSAKIRKSRILFSK
jgi:hypothetical protein